MIDWRTGLTWVPIVVFAVFLLISFVIGLAGGYKRALYWTGGNLALWLIAFIITVAAGNAIATSVAKIVRDNVHIEQIEQLSDAELISVTRMYVGILLYLVTALIGNLLILLPMYFGGFVKWARIGKYDPRSKKFDQYVAKVEKKNKQKAEKLKKQKKNVKMGVKTYFWVSRGVAVPASVVLALPMVCTMTQVAFGGTVIVDNINSSNSSASSLKGLYDFTGWVTNNIGKDYVSNIAENISSSLSGVNLAINKDTNLQKVFEYAEACLRSVDKVQDSLNIESLNQIKDDFRNYGTYANQNRELLEGWLGDVGTNDTLMPIISSLIDTSISSGGSDYITSDIYPNLQVFVDGVINGCTINTVESTSSQKSNIEKIKLDQYSFDWYTNPEISSEFRRLAVPVDAFEVIAKALRLGLFDKTWVAEDDETTMAAAEAITALFFTHDTVDKDVIPLFLDIIVGPNQILYENKTLIESNLSTDDILANVALNIIANSTLTEPQKIAANEYVNRNKSTAAKQILDALSEGGMKIENNFTNVMNEIQKNSSSGVARTEWGSKDNPYIIPLDGLYTLDFEKLGEPDQNYVDFTITGEHSGSAPFTITASTKGKDELPCKATGIFENNTPLWWSFVPHFYPIYAQPDYTITLDPFTEEQQTYLNTYLATDWNKSGRTNSSISTAMPDNLPKGWTFSKLSENSDKPINTYKLTFNYKNNLTGEVTKFDKYFKLTTFFKYNYTQQV